MDTPKPVTIHASALALLELIEQYRNVNESTQAKLDADLTQRMKALTAALAAPSVERLGQFVTDAATRLGWDPKSGEGAFEFIQRHSYAQGVEDARPYWARAYQEGEDVNQAVTAAIRTIETRIADGLASGKLPTT